MPKKIVIVDADNDVRSLLGNSLLAEGYEVRGFSTGGEAENSLAQDCCDMLLIDVDLPGFDGYSLISAIRECQDPAIVIVSGRATLEDRVIGLDIGADDYVVKPFELKEMLARVRSVLRRRHGGGVNPRQEGDWLFFDGWTLNAQARMLRDGAGHNIALTTGEYRLLETLVRNAGQVLNRGQLREALYDDETVATDRSIDVGIMRLRKKIFDDVDNPRIIKTVRNAGYVFVAQISTGH